MIVEQVKVVGISILEAENQSLIARNSERPETSQVARQGMQPPSRKILGLRHAFSVVDSKKHLAQLIGGSTIYAPRITHQSLFLPSLFAAIAEIAIAFIWHHFDGGKVVVQTLA